MSVFLIFKSFDKSSNRETSDGTFLQFEHTNGLNYVHAEVSRFDDLSKLLKIRNTDKFQLNITEGLGAGFLYPRTDAVVLSKEDHDEFHVAGYGISAKAGLNFTFFNIWHINITAFYFCLNKEVFEKGKIKPSFC